MTPASEPLILAVYLAYLAVAGITWKASTRSHSSRPIAVTLTLIPFVHLGIRLTRVHGERLPLPRVLHIACFAIIAICVTHVLSKSKLVALIALFGFAWLAYRCAMSPLSPPPEYALAPVGVTIVGVVATVLDDSVVIDRSRAAAFLLIGWWGPCYELAELGNHDRANVCALLFLIALAVVQLLPPWKAATSTGHSSPPSQASHSRSSSF